MKTFKLFPVYLMLTLFCVPGMNAQNTVMSGSFQFTSDVNRRGGVIVLQSNAQKFEFPLSENIVIANLLPGRYSLIVEYQGADRRMTRLSQTVDIAGERRTICRMNSNAGLTFAKEYDRNSLPISVNNSHNRNDYFDYGKNNNNYDNHYRQEPPMPQVVSGSDFNKLYHAVKSENFSEGKMRTLKTSSNFHPSFTSEQVKSLAQLFNMDDDKLECVKYLAPKVADVQNLPYIKDVFTFESTRNSYLKFLNGMSGRR